MKSERQDLYHIHWSIDPCEGNSGRKSLSDSYGKHYDRLLTLWLSMTSIVFLIEIVYWNIFRCNYLRKIKLFLILFCILLNEIQFWTMSRKRWFSQLMYFWTYGLQKSWLGKCLKSPLSEDSSTSNMVNGPEGCWNLMDRTFTIFIDPCESNSGWKSLSDSHAKYYNCLLTHWLSMTSILFLIETIYWNIFSCNYLKNKKLFVILFCILVIEIPF